MNTPSGIWYRVMVSRSGNHWEKNALEGALRGARLRLARDDLLPATKRQQAVPRGAARALRANTTAY